MGSVAEKLMALPYGCDLSRDELQSAQIEALSERFQQRRSAIRLVAHRAAESAVDEVRHLQDIVPLLFAHTTYKSYPENWLSEQLWHRLDVWLGTLSTHPVSDIDLQDVRDIDDWIARLERAGHFLSCSSGTTGKAAIMNASGADLAWSERESVAAFAWGARIAPKSDRKVFMVGAASVTARGEAVQRGMIRAYGDPASQPYRPPIPPITIGEVTGMVTLRKSIADGLAKPRDLERYEAISAERQKAVESAVAVTAQALVAAREDKLIIFGKWAPLYEVAKVVREMGYRAADFHPENTSYTAGGLKGATLASDYREFVFETFNLAPDRTLQMYSMQELNSSMPKCAAGRYHAPPWVVCLPLDDAGEALVDSGDQEIQARAGFFDLSLDGRWGGVITGDKVSIRFGRCDCGAGGPTIADNITRYADLAGGDKITCAGTIDAYVRGLA